MNRVRVLVTALALACLGLGYLLGAARREPPAPPTYLEQLDDRLGLSDEQTQQLHALLTEEDRDLDELLRRERTELADAIAARRAITEERLLELLTEEQRELYAQAVAPGAGADAPLTPPR